MSHRDFNLLDTASLSRHETVQSGGRCALGKPDVALGASPDVSDSTARTPEADQLDQLLLVHDYERRRMGQELHDAAGQLLVSLQLSVAHLR